MNDEEIKKIVDALSLDAIDKYREFMQQIEDYREASLSSLVDYRLGMADMSASFKNNVARMQQIESLIQSHAQGVQKVYSELEEIKKLLNTTHLEKIIKLLEMSDEVKNDDYLNELKKIINPAFCAKKVIHSFNVFKKEIYELNEFLED